VWNVQGRGRCGRWGSMGRLRCGATEGQGCEGGGRYPEVRRSRNTSGTNSYLRKDSLRGASGLD